MVLLINISDTDLKYYSDIIDCLAHNSLNPKINKIVIFCGTPCGLWENGISKKVSIIKTNSGHKEAMNYVKKISKKYIIYSTPFVKFTLDIDRLFSVVNEKVSIKDDNAYYVFHKSKVLVNSFTIDGMLGLVEKGPSFQKFGYFIKDRSNIEKIGWRFNKENKIEEDFKSDKKKLIVSKSKKEESIKRKIDVVIVSVNYSDYLEITLPLNLKIFNNIKIVTTKEDKKCIEICEKYNVNIVLTERLYEDGAEFNKGKAINDGIESLENPDFILLLDSDIIVTEPIDIDSLQNNVLYYCDRINLETYEDYESFLSGNTKYNLESSGPIGYFQLFDYKKYLKVGKYPIGSSDASVSDVKFSRYITKQSKLIHPVLHLGKTGVNWKGRVSSNFSPKNFISSYFDNIYCINLDRRKDRWEKVKKEFERFDLNVERFSAIDGGSFDSVDISKSNSGKIENNAALSCLLSHYYVIKDAKLKGYSRILIFEDDVFLSNDFEESIKNISNIDWMIMYLGASQFNWNKIEISDGFYKCVNTLGTFAYAIDSSIYDELIELFEKQEKSVDNLLVKIQKKYKNNCYTIYPNIVISNVTDSDIRGSKNLIDYANNVKWDLNSFDNYFIFKAIDFFKHYNRELLEKIEDTTILIKSFMRPECVQRLIVSIRSYYDIKIIVVDDSFDIQNFDYDDDIKTYTIDFDSGLSAGRNYGISKIETPYFILCDDDFIFDKDPNLKKWMEIFKKSDLDILCGDVFVNSNRFGFHGIFEMEDDILYYKPGYREKLDDYNVVDFGPNFFIAKTESIKKTPWDESLKLAEHTPFFLDHMYQLKVGYAKDFLIGNQVYKSSEYKNYRDRGVEYSKKWQKDRGIKKTINLGTGVIERNVFIYWVGPDYSLISILRNLMYEHQKSGKGYKLHHINNDNILDYMEDLPPYFNSLLPAHQADFLRINLLNRYGGIWLDSDMIVINNLDYYFDILERKSGFLQKQEKISIGFMGSRKNNPLFVEWIRRARYLLDRQNGKINWSDIGTNMIEKIKVDLPDLFRNMEILNAFTHNYPVVWNKCVEEFCLKNYENYKNLITKERCDLIMLVNGVYKHFEKKTSDEILNLRLPINYFIDKSISNLNPKIDKEVAFKNLKDITQSLEDHNVIHWLTDGTLLGLYRQGDFISHDLDTDIGIYWKSFDRSVLQSILEKGFKIHCIHGYVEDGFEIALKRNNIKTDLFFFYERGDSFYHSAYKTDKKGKNKIDYVYDKFGVKKTDFLGKMFYIPDDPLKFIKTKYGDEWMIPEEKWDWAFSPKNHVKTEIYINDKIEKIKFREWLQ